MPVDPQVETILAQMADLPEVDLWSLEPAVVRRELQLLDEPRTVTKPDGQSGSLLGPHFDVDEIRSALEVYKGFLRVT